MTEKLIPLLRNIKTKEPSVALATLSVYDAMGKKLGHDIVASDILPALWPMSVGVLLNMDQVYPLKRLCSDGSLIA
jgi:SCY1-like protein 2